jgi:phage antirepressor YoqD-like protein
MSEIDDKDLVVVLQNSQLQIQKLQNVIDILQNKNAELTVQNETWVRVSQSNNTMEMAAVAKVLNYKGLGRNKLFDILRNEKIFRYNNEPYQEYIDRGYFEVIEQEVSTNYGGTLINRKSVVTQKGIDYIRKILDKLGYEYANR